MLRRLTAMLVLVGFVQGYRPSPTTGCERMAPMSGASLLPTGTQLPGPCGQAMTLAQCATGPCAALSQILVGFPDSPSAAITIKFSDRFHDRTPSPPEPPPPQA